MSGTEGELKQSVIELIDNLLKRIDDISEIYRDNNIAYANERLYYLMEDIKTLSEGISFLGNTTNIINIDEINEKLNTLVEEIENEDYLFVADYLEQELKPLLQFWGEQLAYVQ